jgi:hypothetical protein
MTKRKTTEEFISECISIHEFKYDYSKTNYINAKTKVEIICSSHGSFWKVAESHTKLKIGCPKCSGRYVTNTEEFINNSKKLHNNYYDYSKVNYVSSLIKVEIICPIHGSFWQTPGNHSSKKGCISCFGHKKLSTKEFIIKANNIHNNRYDYSETNYVSNNKKVKIHCKEHGIFLQTPDNHLHKKGCPLCVSTISKSETTWLDSFDNPKIIRQYRIIVAEGKHFRVDGYDPTTNTVYEYHGKYWHGHPDVFPDRNAVHPVNKIPAINLYERTLEKEHLLKDLGYNLISVWE